MPQTTYKDVLDHVNDFISGGGGDDGVNLRHARRAVLAAYRELSNRRWSYYYHFGRINTVAYYSTGTIAYTNSTRAIALTDGTFPSWAANGVILINDVPYQVATRDSDTALTLLRASNPGANVASGTTYTLYQDTYVLPPDFVSADEFINVNHAAGLQFVHPRDWLGLQRNSHSPAQPKYYTVKGSPDYMAAMTVCFFPPPDDVYRMDYLYQRRPKPMTWEEYSTGLATTTSGSTTVTGSDTAWSSSMAGAVIRFAASGETKNVPTGRTGSNPFHIERIITSVASASSLTVDIDPGVSLSGVKYSISDPVDVEDGATMTYFLRECEMQMRAVKRAKPTAEEQALYQKAMWTAFESDSRNMTTKAAGAWTGYVPRLADMPYTPPS